VCSCCNNASKSIVHLCVQCEFVEDVWLKLHVWLVKNGHIQLNQFTDIDIILGMKDVDIVVNLCIQITKLSIYRSKLNNTRPTMAAVKANIKHIMNIEKYIAQTNSNMNKFYGKWASKFHSLQH
jgi:hypothetical protein